MPQLIKKYVRLDSSLKFCEYIGYTQFTDMISDEWFDSVKKVIALLDSKRCKGYYEINVEIEVYDEEEYEIILPVRLHFPGKQLSSNKTQFLLFQCVQAC